MLTKLFATLPVAFSFALCASAQNLVWESQGLTDEQTVASGSTYLYNGSTATLTWSTTTDGGAFTFYDSDGVADSNSVGGGKDYVTYESSQEGAHTGLILMGFDNESYDKDDFISFRLAFSVAQTNIAFSILDIDSSNWDDLVTLHYNTTLASPLGGTDVVTNTALWSYAASSTDRTFNSNTVNAENPPAGAEWEAIGDDGNGNGNDDGVAAASNQNFGNVNINLSGISVTSLVITFRSSNDSNGNPGGQKIGVSDLFISSSAIPEINTNYIAFFATMAVLTQALLRKRKSNAERK